MSQSNTKRCDPTKFKRGLQAKRGKLAIKMLGLAESTSFRLVCGLDCSAGMQRALPGRPLRLLEPRCKDINYSTIERPVRVSDAAVSIAGTPWRAVRYFPCLFHGRRSSSSCCSSFGIRPLRALIPRQSCPSRRKKNQHLQNDGAALSGIQNQACY